MVSSVSATIGDKSYVVAIACVGEGCGAQEVVFHMTSPVPLTLPPVGAFVEAEYLIRHSFACSYFVRFSNLPELNGQKNPLSDVSAIYLLASDGLVSHTTQAAAAVGVTVELVPFGCAPGAGRGCGAQVPLDTYAFRFSQDARSVILAMGESTSFAVGDQIVRIENLRSYQSEACDDYWNWAFIFEHV